MQPKIYTKQQHGIQLSHIDRNALYVLEKLRNAGFIAYLVGGSVRDLLLKIRPKDFDISTSARPEEIKDIFPNCILIGRRFRLAHIRFGRKILEVSTFRSGDIESEELILRDNIWGSPEEDVLRRDFTINGLFFDDATQTIIDYVGGFADVQKRFLQTIGNPFLRFKQDPVRMIRLLKFMARLNFESDPLALQALLECRSEILKSSQARVLEELLRMLESGASRSFIRLMTDHYILELLLPVIGEFLETKESLEIFSYLEEADKAIKEPKTKNLERSVLLCCLIFPIFEKKLQKKFLDKDQIPHLGQIQEEAIQITKEIFDVFFHLPKRYKTQMTSIMTSQYRLTPLSPKKMRRIRIPKIPDFDMALDFFRIRSCLEPGFQKIYEEWQKAFKKIEGAPPQSRRKKTRKRYGRLNQTKRN
ncbi:MAG: polynucleotide adenylyltransferase PcnB [Simkaniaceae bacterium]